MSGNDADLKVGSTGEKAISDARLDRALRTMLAREDRPVDLRARVITAIDAPIARPRWRVAAAAAFCVAAVLLAAALAIWPGGRDGAPDRAAQDVGTGAADGRDAADRPTQLHPNLPRAADTASTGHPRSRRAVGRTRVSGSPAADRPGEPWDAALPPLAPPDPIVLEQMDEPAVQVVGLRIERLSIDPLEMDPLERSREE